MLVLFTDFSLSGPYIGQMQAVLLREAPGVPVINLFADVPRCNPKAAAYLLAAYAEEFPAHTVFLTVVDPGVGGVRQPVVVEADGRWYVGPDNGLLSQVVARATDSRCWRISWRPARLSASFHGRDLFAPVAARLARGESPPGEPLSALCAVDWPAELAEVIYLDHFGNAMTGLRAASLPPTASIAVHGQTLHYAETFSAVAPGEAFWYANANGLVELAVNQGEAASTLGLQVGTQITFGLPAA